MIYLLLSSGTKKTTEIAEDTENNYNSVISVSSVVVKVRLFAGMRDHAGVKDADVQGKNVGEVLDSLVNAYPLLKTQIFKEDGDILPHVRVLLNGIAISDLDTELKIGDELAVFPPVGGG